MKLIRTFGLLFTVICAAALAQTDGLYCGRSCQPLDDTAMLLVSLSEEQICFAAINQFRSQHGLPALQWNEGLADNCRNWSATMQRTGRFQHGANNENIAMGHPGGERTFQQWKNSSGHRAFLLSRNITTAAVGQSGEYWTFRGSGNGYQTTNYQETKTTQTHQKQSSRPFNGALRKAFRGRLLRY